MNDNKKLILILLCSALLIMVFSSVGFLYPYILHYNAGNKAYEAGDYTRAEEEYARALSEYVPEGRECDIRDNWALTILAQLKPIDEIQDDEVDDTLSELHRASDILTEVGCADEERANYAHDYNSQELEEEILEYIRILEERQNSDNKEENKDKKDNKDEENNSDPNEEKTNNSNNSSDNNGDNQADKKDSDGEENKDNTQNKDGQEEQKKDQEDQSKEGQNQEDQKQIGQNNQQEEPEETPQQKLDRERQEKLMQDQRDGTAERNQNMDWDNYSSDYEFYSGKNW